jgi:hypothetical protein
MDRSEGVLRHDKGKISSLGAKKIKLLNISHLKTLECGKTDKYLLKNTSKSQHNIYA